MGGRTISNEIIRPEEPVWSNLPYNARVVAQPSSNTTHTSQILLPWEQGFVQSVRAVHIGPSPLSQIPFTISSKSILPPPGRLQTVPSIGDQGPVSRYLASAFSSLAQPTPAPIAPLAPVSAPVPVPVPTVSFPSTLEGSLLPPVVNLPFSDFTTWDWDSTSDPDFDLDSDPDEGPYQRLLDKPLGYNSCLDPWNAASPYLGGADFPDWRFEADISMTSFKTLEAPIADIDRVLTENMRREEEKMILPVQRTEPTQWQPTRQYWNVPVQPPLPPKQPVSFPAQYVPTPLRECVTVEESEPATPATPTTQEYSLGARRRDGMSILERRMARQREGTRKSARKRTGK